MQGTNLSYFPVLSADGRYVVFTTWATNLVPGDTNATADVLVAGVYAAGETRDLYYSAGWQVVEERAASGQTVERNVWSPVYVDALVVRTRDTDANGTLDERLWVQQDANWNVTAVVDDAGTVVERYAYDPFGVRTVLDANWGVDVDGVSDYAVRNGHQGLRYDPSAGLYHNRMRDYSATLGRFTSTDPIGFAAGDTNLYRYEANGPITSLDPSGLDYTYNDGKSYFLRRTYYLSYGWLGNKDVSIFIGREVERNGRLYLQFGQYLVPKEKALEGADNAGGNWKDSQKQLQWFRENATTDFSSTYGSGFRKNFGTEMYGAVDGARRAATDEYYSTYVYGIGAGAAGATGGGAFRLQGIRNLTKLGLQEVQLANQTYNAGRKSLEATGFILTEVTKTGRKVFTNSKTGAQVMYDSGKALAPGQKPHWHIKDSAGQGYTRGGNACSSDDNAGHIPAG